MKQEPIRWVKKPIHQIKEKHAHQDETYNSLSVFWSWGWRVALEWGAAVGVGAFLGTCIDRQWHLDSMGLVIGLLIGSVAGVLNIYRSCQKHFERVNRRFSV